MELIETDILLHFPAVCKPYATKLYDQLFVVKGMLGRIEVCVCEVI